MADLTYPVSVGADGQLGTSNDLPTLVKGAIMSGLATVREERVMRPEYGLDVSLLSTYGSVVPILSRCREALELALDGYPETTFELSGYPTESGSFVVLVAYQVADREYSIELTL